MNWIQSILYFVLCSTTLSQDEQVQCEIRGNETCFTTTNPFICGSGEIIDRDKFCNFQNDCRDASDEEKYSSSNMTGIRCTGLADHPDEEGYILARACLLPNRYVCDGTMECDHGEDECGCKHTMRCDAPPSGLGLDQHCIGRTQFCDNILDCHDTTDERKYGPGVEGFQCAVTKLRVTSYCMLPTRNTCDGVADCDDGTDECFCAASGLNTITYWNYDCFRCLDGSFVIPSRQLCDNVFHCQDLSDECLCPKKPQICSKICQVGQDCGDCESGQVICETNDPSSAGKCINRTNVCDENYDCPLQEDELNCNVDVTKLFNCSDGLKYIPMHRVCDNFSDCEDRSDEKDCDSKYIECQSCYRAPYGSESERTGAFDFSRPRYTTACDGIPTCEDLEDECNNSLCGALLPGYCSKVQGKCGFVCQDSNATLIGTEVCDGAPHCNATFPQYSSDEWNCTKRYYCKDRGASRLPIHIPLSAQCNNVSDCYDHSDEIGCNSTTHFYCTTGLPKYLPRHQVCNGIQDCANGEDECQNCTKSPFSSDKFLISSYVLQVFIWITGLFAVFGNIGVLFHNSRQLLTNKHSLSVVAYNHRILVTNLALADLLLGVYLISLGSTNSVYEDVYCRRDIQWRASRSCAAIGSIAVISVECSVFLLAIMATMRVFLVTGPVHSPSQRKHILLAVAFAWIISLILALVPLAESQMDYFVSELWYANNPFLGLVNRDQMESFTTLLWTVEDVSNNAVANNVDRTLNWNNMIETVSRLNETFVPSLYFGYYSAHGVCLPRIFPDPSVDRSYGFSLLIIIINFLMFLYMLVAYIVIYRITITKHQRAGGVTNDETNIAFQRKITRIILTNFCCWIPICIMAFVSAGGHHVSDEAYAVSAIILLPINSAFNPFLYSDLPEFIWDKIFAQTACGKWVESKHLARMESKRKKSLQGTQQITRQTELTTTPRPSMQSSVELSRL